LEDANIHNLRMVETVEGLNNLIATNNREIEIWRRKCIEVEEERSREILELQSGRGNLIEDLRRYKDGITELEQRVIHLSEENNYMREVSNKVPELEESVRQMELHASKFIDDHNRYQIAQQEIQLLHSELSRQQQRADGVYELESKLALMIEENEKMLKFNEERVHDIDVLKRQLKNTEILMNEKNLELEQWKIKYSSLTSNVEILKQSFEEYRRFQRQSWERVSSGNQSKSANAAEITQLNAHVSILQNQIDTLHEEKTALVKTNLERSREIETLNYEIDDRSSNILQLSAERDICKRRSMHAEERLIKYEAEISSLKAQLNQYKALNDNTKNEINKLYELLRNRKEDYERVADQLLRTEKELLHERQKRAGAAENFESSKEDIIVLAEEKKRLDLENSGLRKILETAHSEAEERDREIGKLNKQLADLENKYREAVALINSLEQRFN
jgi:chromosome segregation protein